jgi:hypothetical protein
MLVRNPNGRDNLGNLDRDRRILLKRISNNDVRE